MFTINYKKFTAHFKSIREMKRIVTGVTNEPNTSGSEVRIEKKNAGLGGPAQRFRHGIQSERLCLKAN